MKLRIPMALAAIGATVIATVVASAGPAGADDVFEMVGWAGGSIVHAVDGTVTSALTAASSIEGPKLQSQTNSLASLKISSLIDGGAVQTDTSSFLVPGGVEVLSHVLTTGVSLLGGAIKAQAIDTTATAVYIGGVVTSNTSTTFVGLHIGNSHIPLNIPKNLNIDIPNVAQVVLNVTFTATQTGTAVMTEGAALYVSLLKPRGQNAIGASVSLNPTYAALELENPSGTHVVRGSAYGTAVYAAVGKLVNVQSDPTAPISMPGGGTHGVVQYNTVAGVDLNPVLAIGAVTTSAYGVDTDTLLDSKFTSEIAGVNLFNGAIKADAISVTAHASGPPGGPYESDGTATIVNLTIGGKKIPLNVSPNTVINVLGLGTITLDQQVKTSNAILERAIDIKLSTAKYGLPVGAEVQIATATASVF